MRARCSSLVQFYLLDVVTLGCRELRHLCCHYQACRHLAKWRRDCTHAGDVQNASSISTSADSWQSPAAAPPPLRRAPPPGWCGATARARARGPPSAAASTSASPAGGQERRRQRTASPTLRRGNVRSRYLEIKKRYLRSRHFLII